MERGTTPSFGSAPLQQRVSVQSRGSPFIGPAPLRDSPSVSLMHVCPSGGPRDLHFHKHLGHWETEFCRAFCGAQAEGPALGSFAASSSELPAPSSGLRSPSGLSALEQLLPGAQATGSHGKSSQLPTGPGTAPSPHPPPPTPTAGHGRGCRTSSRALLFESWTRTGQVPVAWCAPVIRASRGGR